MSGPALKMLLIEDDLPVAELIAAMLRKTKDMVFEVTVAGDLQSGLRCLETNVIDAIFLDLTLPDSNGLGTITKVQAKAPAVPIIVLTGIDDEALASHAVREGAQDYIVKGHVDITMLVRSVRYAVERKRAQEALRNARDELELRVQERTAELLRVNESLKKEIEERKHAERAAQVLNLKLKETQAQLIQAAKMQVVGGLASGVAHEVKNPLAIILQGVEFLEKKVPRDDSNVALTLGYIRSAVERADAIVRGLMDFASISQLNIFAQPLLPVLDKTLMLLKHQCDKQHIQVVREFPENIPPVNIDRNKIEQVFLNLLMNAADAMPQGGKLVVRSYIEYGNGMQCRPAAGAGEEKPHRFVIVEIDDNGAGIPANVLERIFDPFFTTKRTQGGTGLGLTIVRNILDLHGARIAVTIKGESGTRVKVEFPA